MTCLDELPTIRRPLVMGIVNVTPDSFFDGGQHFDPARAVDHALALLDEGADIVDIGGESTRPGAEPVSLEAELARVMPVIEALRPLTAAAISVDTSTAGVMRQAVAAGADLINDVRALRREGALEAAAETGLPVCLMHMKGDPKTMQMDPRYDDLLAEVAAFFEARIRACGEAGIPAERLILDPGFGFGKTPAHNLQIINRLDRFGKFGLPLLVGLSRKSTIGKVLEGVSDDRLYGSIAGAVMAVAGGAAIVRVHDVRPTVEALRVASAIMEEGLPR